MKILTLIHFFVSAWLFSIGQSPPANHLQSLLQTEINNQLVTKTNLGGCGIFSAYEFKTPCGLEGYVTLVNTNCYTIKYSLFIGQDDQFAVTAHIGIGAKELDIQVLDFVRKGFEMIEKRDCEVIESNIVYQWGMEDSIPSINTYNISPEIHKE